MYLQINIFFAYLSTAAKLAAVSAVVVSTAVDRDHK